MTNENNDNEKYFIFDLDETLYKLDENYFITCVKSGFYDSALIFNVDGLKIFNLNDCPIESHDDIKRFKKNLVYVMCY